MVASQKRMSPDGDLAEALLQETRHGVSEIRDVLLGDGVNEGVVGRLSHLERSVRELQEQGRLKFVPAEQPDTIRAKAEAWAIRIGAGLAILGAAVKAYQELYPGGLP